MRGRSEKPPARRTRPASGEVASIVWLWLAGRPAGPALAVAGLAAGESGPLFISAHLLPLLRADSCGVGVTFLVPGLLWVLIFGLKKLVSI